MKVNEELLAVGQMLECGAEPELDIDAIKSEFDAFVRGLAMGVRQPDITTDKIRLLAGRNSRRKDALPKDICVVLDVEPGTTYSEVLVAARFELEKVAAVPR